MLNHSRPQDAAGVAVSQLIVTGVGQSGRWCTHTHTHTVQQTMPQPRDDLAGKSQAPAEQQGGQYGALQTHLASGLCQLLLERRAKILSHEGQRQAQP